ncbi:catalase family peroxidase [Mycolicibacterium frederiksbergense]|uniref:catalase family peroxidase n=1 Tax=Mycolicibacterium frederiksbergense TaxID=117567 RepID=UPI0021F349E6|nr:catalase family peroxidase [Mycolicibacterium frederiksbergense]
MKARPKLIPSSWAESPIDRRSVLLGAAAIGGFLTLHLGSVACARGPVGSGGRLTPQAFIDAFHHVNGVHRGFRRNHAKGVSVTGYFESNGNGADLSRAAVFRPGRTKLVGRFSLPGGNPTVADTAGANRGLALVFGYPESGQWRTAMLNIPVFPVNSPQGFYDQLLASKPVADTGKPDPEAMAQFLAAHPETARATKVIKAQPPTSGFADSTYRGLNAFLFANAAGDVTPVRWSLVPMQPIGTAATSGAGPNWMFDDLITAIRQNPLRWRLMLTVAEPQDDLTDATVAWPPERRVVDAGTVVLDAVERERRGNARDINFDPLVLPDGIAPSDDPLLTARSAVYAASFRRRAGESTGTPAVETGAVSR